MNRLFFAIAFMSAICAKLQLNVGEDATLFSIILVVFGTLAIVTNKTIRDYL